MRQATRMFETHVKQFGALLDELAQLERRAQDTTGDDAPSLRRVESSIRKQSVRTSIVEAHLRAVEHLVSEVRSRTECFFDARLGSEDYAAGPQESAAQMMYSVATPPSGSEHGVAIRELGFLGVAEVFAAGVCRAHRDIFADRDVFLE